MTTQGERKKELDRIRTEWRKTHRALDGKIILYPDKPPEHINARGNKVYNWFWQKILLKVDTHDIPALISAIKQQIRNEDDGRKIRKLRTMIGMADDAYKLKQLEDIQESDVELNLGEKSIYDADQGRIYQDGNIYTVEFSEEEDKILIRDVEGIIVDIQYGNNGGEKPSDTSEKKSTYENWNYLKKT